ncbi:hypothetical protein SERLA73DRAFT_191057 [Serpula lacrymans var. lacrymans S7.3]|uniref:Nuclear rim protein 1 n=2 Tax=Serpula lacrymans var. lacrymans TaxID=341189 RepID=F8QGU7_SERL3|nr:uncharacterized protein SERLADRAFT_480645 [Serpula lacrymans var. lacrymans S7.9]EGN92429.1 hypothetical protein SERLA73DRAFT_191057 [Serpula lacrymans var. lacrymans S7.3]EGO18555.1 hypothetical protein SERLADRAFT_480645 [Serpula lacrymans var. lacrymans S7.9]
MSLRRFAQTQSATTAPGSPISHNGSGTQTPVTPRTRISYVNSPSSTPSISSSTPFDWEAARSRRPPPYATPLAGKRKARMSTGTGSETVGMPKRVVRKKGIIQRISSIPSWIAFELSQFPNNLPLPAPKTSAFLIGASMHLLHLWVRVAQAQAISDADLGWEDMYRERDGLSWFDWTVPATFLLLGGSTLNALHLFTQTRIYRIYHRTDPVSSPHATFVPSPSRAQSTSVINPTPTLVNRLLRLFKSLLIFFWRLFVSFWRFLLGISPASPSTPSPGSSGRAKQPQMQQLEVWTPGELERVLLTVYSPVHALAWMATGTTNWVLMAFVMGGVGLQMHGLVKAYEALLKDKEIIAAEVMAEYNEGFVYPRINPIRKDVAVMTHQSEMVNIWED